MAVTPEDVNNKQFTTSRFKEGYDLDEVDDFLDQVAEALTELTREAQDLRATAKGEVPASIREEISKLNSENSRLKNELETARSENQELAANGSDNGQADELRAKLTAAQSELATARQELANAASGQGNFASQIEQLNKSLAQLTETNEKLAKENEELKNAAPPMELGEASSASVRLLELAQRTADEAVANARIESDNLRNSTESEVLKMMTETKANIAIMSRDFDAQKAAMERRVEELRAHEREYRSRLRSYLEGQLRELETKNLGGDRQVEG